jgi:hypothetical protein
MPSELTFVTEPDGYRAFAGRFCIGGASLQEQGPRPYWRWSIAVSGASGIATDTDDAQREHRQAWTAWLQRAGIADGPSPLRVVPATEYRHAVMSRAITIGTLASDPFSGMDLRIKRPKVSPWMWAIHRDYDVSGGAIHGGAETKERALAALTTRWLRWLSFASLNSP